MENITNDGKAFWTWWEITEGSLSESGDEPDDEAEEESSNKEVNRAVAANHRHPNKPSDSRGIIEGSLFIGSGLGWELRRRHRAV